MRILQYVTNFLYGTETFIYNEVLELSRSNELKVVCIHRYNEERFPFADLVQVKYPQTPGKGILRLRFEDWNLANISYRQSSFQREIQQIIEEFQPEVIHCQFGTEAGRFLENFTRTDIPVFITFHGNDASEKLRSRIYLKRMAPLLARKNVFPIFVSKFLQSRFLEKIPLNRHFLVYCGIDISQFHRTQHPAKQPFTFFQVSSFREKKGHACTIEAFSKMLQKHPEVDSKLILAGDGPLLAPMKDLTQKLGIADKVHFPGFINSTTAREMMDQSHAFVHHSITAANGDTEGLPTSIMEAMAMELPVLSTYHSGIPELVTHNENGFLAKEKDLDTYADQMFEVMRWNYLPQNREKIIQMCEKGRHAQQLMELYQQAINELR